MSIGEFGRDLKYLQGLSASLKEEIRVRQEALHGIQNEIVALTTKFKVGDRVYHHKKLYEVVRVAVQYGDEKYVGIYGKKFLKSGSLGVQEFDLYGNITLAEEGK